MAASIIGVVADVLRELDREAEPTVFVRSHPAAPDRRYVLSTRMDIPSG